MSSKRRASDEIQRNKENKIIRKSENQIRSSSGQQNAFNFQQQRQNNPRPIHSIQFQRQAPGLVMQNHQQPGPRGPQPGPRGPQSGPRGPLISYKGQQLRLGQQVTGELKLPTDMTKIAITKIPGSVSVSPIRVGGGVKTTVDKNLPSSRYNKSTASKPATSKMSPAGGQMDKTASPAYDVRRYKVENGVMKFRNEKENDDDDDIQVLSDFIHHGSKKKPNNKLARNEKGQFSRNEKTIEKVPAVIKIQQHSENNQQKNSGIQQTTNNENKKVEESKKVENNGQEKISSNNSERLEKNHHHHENKEPKILPFLANKSDDDTTNSSKTILQCPICEISLKDEASKINHVKLIHSMSPEELKNLTLALSTKSEEPNSISVLGEDLKKEKIQEDLKKDKIQEDLKDKIQDDDNREKISNVDETKQPVVEDDNNKMEKVEEKDKNDVGHENDIFLAKIDNQNNLMGNPEFSKIHQTILSLLDHQSQLAFRAVCQTMKTQVDQPDFWMKKLEGRQPKNLHNAWVRLVGRIPKGSDLEKEVAECLIKWYGKYQEYTEKELNGMMPIFVAARFGCIGIVKFIATFTFNLNTPKMDRMTPIHTAAQYNNTEIFQFIASKVENPNAPNADGWTPLHIAAKHGNTDIFKFLASKVENPNSPTPNGLTPLHITAQHGHTEIFKFISTKVENPNAHQPDGWTPLHWAARKGHLEIFKILAAESKNGKNLNDADPNGWTPLHWAAQNGHIEMLKFLASKVENPNTPSSTNGETPLKVASKNNQIEVVSVLLKILSEKVFTNSKAILNTLK